MTIRIEEPKRNIDWFSSTLHVLKFAKSSYQMEVFGAIDELKGLWGNLLVETDSTENRGWIGFRQTLALATLSVLGNPRVRSALTNEEAAAQVEEFVSDHMPGSTELEPVHLINPSAHTSVRNAEKFLPDLIRRTAPDCPYKDEDLILLFRQSLADATGAVFASAPETFKDFVSAIDGPMAEGQRRNLAWARHARWVQRQFTIAPIFSTDEDEKTPLSSVYLAPRCFWHNMAEDDGEDEPSEGRRTSRRRIAHVAMLHETLHAWLDDKSGDKIRIVTGGPGSGKSSFARAFATEVLSRLDHRLIFINLQRLSTYNEDLYKSIGEHCERRNSRTSPNGSEGFPDNPLDWREDDENDILIIFDGLDEL